MATPIQIGAAAGEYMEAAVVLEWAIAEGAAVRRGDLVVTIETAKAATEIEAPCDGVLTRILAAPGTEVELTAVLGLIGVDAGDVALPGGAAPDALPPAAPAAAAPAPVRAASGRVVASPAARRAAAAQGIDLASLRPTSPTGRIKLRDVAAAEGAEGLKVYRGGQFCGTPIVLLHGFGSDSEAWFPLDRMLGEAYPVIRIDLPSHGRSPKRQLAGFDALVGEVAAALDALKLDRAHLVGHSLGGACALALADARPEAFASLTLIAPAGLGPQVAGDILGGIARASRPESLGPWLRQTVADRALVSDAYVRAAMATRADPALRAAQQATAEALFPDDTQGFDLTGALARLAVPARIIWGRKDAVFPWQQALAAPGRVGLHLIGDVGHVPQMEATETVAGIIRALIRSA